MGYRFNPFTGTLDIAGTSGSDPNPEVTAVYFGDPDTDDSWRIIRSGNNLAFERREAGVWVEKSAVTPS